MSDCPPVGATECHCPCINCSTGNHWMCQHCTIENDGEMVDLGDGISVCLQPGAVLTDEEKAALREYFQRLRSKQ